MDIDAFGLAVGKRRARPRSFLLSSDSDSDSDSERDSERETKTQHTRGGGGPRPAKRARGSTSSDEEEVIRRPSVAARRRAAAARATTQATGLPPVEPGDPLRHLDRLCVALEPQRPPADGTGALFVPSNTSDNEVKHKGAPRIGAVYRNLRLRVVRALVPNGEGGEDAASWAIVTFLRHPALPSSCTTLKGNVFCLPTKEYTGRESKTRPDMLVPRATLQHSSYNGEYFLQPEAPLEVCRAGFGSDPARLRNLDALEQKRHAQGAPENYPRHVHDRFEVGLILERLRAPEMNAGSLRGRVVADHLVAELDKHTRSAQADPAQAAGIVAAYLASHHGATVTALLAHPSISGLCLTTYLPLPVIAVLRPSDRTKILALLSDDPAKLLHSPPSGPLSLCFEELHPYCLASVGGLRHRAAASTAPQEAPSQRQAGGQGGRGSAAFRTTGGASRYNTFGRGGAAAATAAAHNKAVEDFDAMCAQTEQAAGREDFGGLYVDSKHRLPSSGSHRPYDKRTLQVYLPRLTATQLRPEWREAVPGIEPACLLYGLLRDRLLTANSNYTAMPESHLDWVAARSGLASEEIEAAKDLLSRIGVLHATTPTIPGPLTYAHATEQHWTLTRERERSRFIGRALCSIHHRTSGRDPTIEGSSKRLLSSMSRPGELASAVRNAAKGLKIKLDRTQQQAAASIQTHSLSIITGGPGTGKTSILTAAGAVLYGIQKLKQHMLVLCPTGAACSAVSDHLLAVTVHRFVLAVRGKVPERLGLASFEDLETIVFEECSMIGEDMLAGALAALHQIPSVTRLLFVGDVDQLPSVGTGAVLRDLIGLAEEAPEGALPDDFLSCTRLVRNYRCNPDVQALAAAVLKGDVEATLAERRYTFHAPVVRDRREAPMQAAYETAWSTVKGLLADGVPMHNVRIMAYRRTDVAKLQAPLLDMDPGVSSMAKRKAREDTLVLGQLVIVKANCYFLHVFNGLRARIETMEVLNEEGEVVAMPHVIATRNKKSFGETVGTRQTLRMTLRSPSRPDRTHELYFFGYGARKAWERSPPAGCNPQAAMSKLRIQDVVHGYAMTVHTSQGAQVPHVVVVPWAIPRLAVGCDRSLVFTAVTRCLGMEGSVTLVNEDGMLQTALAILPRPRGTLLANAIVDAVEVMRTSMAMCESVDWTAFEYKGPEAEEKEEKAPTTDTATTTA